MTNKTALFLSWHPTAPGWLRALKALIHSAVYFWTVQGHCSLCQITQAWRGDQILRPLFTLAWAAPWPSHVGLELAHILHCAPCVCVWSHCTMLRLRGRGGGGRWGGLRMTKCRPTLILSPHAMLKCSLVRGTYLWCPPEELTCQHGSTFLSSTDLKGTSW